MEIGHNVGLVCFYALVVERVVLLIEVMEVGVRVELVEFIDEVVDVHVLPTLFKIGLLAKELYSPPVDVKVDGHTHHGIITDAILIVQTLEAGHGGVLLVGREPTLGVPGVLSRHVHVVLLVARRACENAHQFDGLADFSFDLRLPFRCEESE